MNYHLFKGVRINEESMQAAVVATGDKPQGGDLPVASKRNRDEMIIVAS
jgi:hypothetical protein